MMDQDTFAVPPPMPTMPSSPIPIVEYNTPRADQVPRRRYVVMLVLAAVFGALLLGIMSLRMTRSATPVVLSATPAMPAPVIVSPSAGQISQQIAESRQRSNQARLNTLMTSPLPPTQVVYEEEPVAARQLFGKGVCNAQASRHDMSQPFFSAFEPPVYQCDGFWQGDNAANDRDALLFAGPLLSPNGINQRLVMLEMEVKLDGTKLANDEYKVGIFRKFTYRICKPQMSGSWPDEVRNGVSLTIVQPGERNIIPIKWIDGTLRSARPKEYNLRFFAGQPDLKDPTHFTVDYEVGGVKGTIDGWLTDDDFLRIIPRGGTVNRGTWNIEGVK